MKHKKNITHFAYPKDIDKELVPLLDTINSIPGLRTMFCCCGHGKEAFYIVIACCNEDAQKIALQAFGMSFDEWSFKKDFSSMYLHTPKVWSKDRKFYTIVDLRDAHELPGVTSQEKITLSVYSCKVGMMKPKDRKVEISKLKKNFMQFVPEFHWWK